MIKRWGGRLVDGSYLKKAKTASLVLGKLHYLLASPRSERRKWQVDEDESKKRVSGDFLNKQIAFRLM